MENNRRVQRVEKELREIISGYMVFKMSGLLEGFPSLTRVIVSKDLRTVKALIYCQDLEDMHSNVDILNDEAHSIQSEINKQIRMKYCPKVKFIADTKYDDALKVHKELKKIADDDESDD